ncbi:unnamed protein product [Auanema sp. JU1783]|nr:unnamed protein product [Auanema sp. JU1783]
MADRRFPSYPVHFRGMTPFLDLNDNERRYEESDTLSTASSGEYSVENEMGTHQTSEHSDSSSDITEIVDDLYLGGDRIFRHGSETTFVQLLNELRKNNNIMRVIQELKPELYERMTHIQ